MYVIDKIYFSLILIKELSSYSYYPVNICIQSVVA
jgi:hypothetical protein